MKVFFLIFTLTVCIPTVYSQTQQGIRVSGMVADDNGESLPGVNIVVRGNTSIGTNTDTNGEFSLTVPSDTCVLQISFIGFLSQEIQVGNRRILSVILKEDVAELEEVVVVAFGKQKKGSVIASVSTINTKDLKVPSSNLTTALAGRMSGLVSYQRSGEPGQDDASFFVRGVTSLTYASSPLILIDGVEMATSDLARLQPDDIASFSIMKDAAASALYGARGANGVILVTTREGKEGKVSISLRVESSLSTPTQNVKLADPITYMRLNNEAVLTRNNNMVSVPYSMEKIEMTENPNRNPYVYPANDWYGMLFNNEVVNYRANFNVSGGGKIARYYIAATFNQDNGVLKVDKMNNFNNNIDLKRYLLRSNINIDLTPTTEVVVRLHGTFDDYRGPIDGGSTLYQKAMRADPVLFPPLYKADRMHEYVEHPLFGNTDRGQYINPYADMVRGYMDYNKSLFLAQFELKQDLGFITEGLRLRGLFNTNRYAYYEVQRSTVPFYYSIGFYDKYADEYSLVCLNPEGGREWLDYSESGKKINTTVYGEAALNYDRIFDKHTVSGMLVSTMRNYLETDATDVMLSLPRRNVGLSGRFTYSFLDRYYTEFNFGYNGSERFAKNERFGFFPSAGVGYIISNEDFWNDDISRIFSKLKLKATYGLVGNDAIGDSRARFFYMSNVNMDDAGRFYVFGTEFSYGRTGVSVSRYANDKITWETSKKMNLGIELGLFDKIEIVADYYTEHREGILLTRTDIPTTSGLQNAIPQANLGKAFGEGIDFSIDYNHNFNKYFWITGRANFTYAKTKYTEYEEVDNTLTPWLSRVGQPVSQRWGLVAERLFVDDYEVNNSPPQNFGEYAGGDIKYKDIDGDGQITSLDQVPIGFPTEPQIIYGFGLSSGFKNWDFSFFFQGLAQESFWINTRYDTGPSTVPFVDTNYSGVVSKNALLKAYADNHWSEDNKNIYALWPRLSDRYMNNNFAVYNTWFMRNGAFMRLKSAELGYTLPQAMMNKIKINNCRFYFSGTNLLTFSAFKMWDPEMAGNGLGYPIQKVLNLGLQISF